MQRYLALLRGVNVSGKNIIKMEDLRRHMETAGFSNVKTLIQSGNIVFESSETEKQKLTSAVTKLLADNYGYAITVFVLDAKELSDAISGNPFTDNREPEPSGAKKLHITILSEIPSEEKMKALREGPIGNDKLELAGNVLYFLLETKSSDSKLSNALLESKLKVKGTTRNWNTMLKLEALMA